MCGLWLNGITGFDLRCVVPVLIYHFGGMFEQIIVRKGSVVGVFGLVLGVTLYRLAFHIHECCLGCVEHMRTVSHFFLYIVHARGASLLDPSCLTYVCFIAGFAGQFVYTTFIVFLGDVLLSRFGKLLYCICVLEGYFFVCMFKEVGYFPDF